MQTQPRSLEEVVSGNLLGESTVEYLMASAQDGSASFVGLERFVGWLGNRSESFVLQHYGSLVGDISKVYWLVVAGSGTGEPRGLRGVGSLNAGNEKRTLLRSTMSSKPPKRPAVARSITITLTRPG